MTAEQSDAEGAPRALNKAFVRHFNAGNADGLARAVYAKDARLLPPGRPMIVGRAPIAEALREFLEAGMGGLTVDTFEVEVA
jgi:ketosteroid isomerase-like protein